MVWIIKRILYCFGWCLFRGGFTLFWRLKIYGAEHIPRKGPVILASHHRSNADPPIVGCSLFREVFFVAKEELFRLPVFKMIITLVNGLPIKRGKSDVKGFKQVIRLLKNGKVLLLFPEGHRNPTDNFLKPKPGVGFLASYCGVPVVPVFVVNTDKLLWFKKIYVFFGKPMHFNKSDDYRMVAEQIMDGIKRLKDAA